MGLKKKLVGLVGIVALAAGMAFGGLAVADGTADEPVDSGSVAYYQGWPAKWY